MYEDVLLEGDELMGEGVDDTEKEEGLEEEEEEVADPSPIEEEAM